MYFISLVKKKERKNKKKKKKKKKTNNLEYMVEKKIVPI